jgi:hypothetical protein
VTLAIQLLALGPRFQLATLRTVLSEGSVSACRPHHRVDALFLSPASGSARRALATIAMRETEHSLDERAALPG